VLAFIFTGQYEGIGFLVAAKSIFRFGGISETDKRKESEYILIGSLLSFGLAIFIGILFKALARVAAIP